METASESRACPIPESLRNHRGMVLTLFAFSGSMVQVRILMILLGLVSGLYLPSAIATITATVKRQEWGKAPGLHQIAPRLALVVGPLRVVTVPLSWRTLLPAPGTCTMAVGVLYALRCREGGFAGEASRPVILETILVLPCFWIMLLLFAVAIAWGVGLFSMLPLYLVTKRGFSARSANLVQGLSRISWLFMPLAAGWLADRPGERRALAGVLFSVAAVTMLLALVPDRWVLPALFLQPVLTVCFFLPAFSALSRIVPSYLRRVSTSLATPIAFLLGGGMGPLFLGIMGETRGFGPGIALVGALLTRFLQLRDEAGAGC